MRVCLEFNQIPLWGQVPVAQACNPSYLGGWDWEDLRSRPSRQIVHETPPPLHLQSNQSKMDRRLRWGHLLCNCSNPIPTKKKKASFLSSKIIGTSIKLLFIFYFFGGTGAGTQVLGRFSTAWAIPPASSPSHRRILQGTELSLGYGEGKLNSPSYHWYFLNISFIVHIFKVHMMLRDR
jgi:hypothetical protein